MKFNAIYITFLFVQVSTSLLDDFRSAIVNVEQGFGKLLTDVVTDMKDTIHCTISAVEKVLVLNGLLDQTSAYNYRCREFSVPIEPTPTPPPKILDHRSGLDQLKKSKDVVHRMSPKHISMELGKSIANVNKTINEILNQDQKNNTLNVVFKTMKDETNRLTEISKILKRELDNISSNIKVEIKKLHYDSKVESIMEEIKTLDDIQQSSKNTTEINEIRNVLDKVVDKLSLDSDDNKISGNYNLKEIKKKLQKYSESVNKNNDQVVKDAPTTSINATKKILHNDKNMDPKNLSTTETSLLDSELQSLDYFTPFSNTNTNKVKILNDINKIIEDSQSTDTILNNIFNEHRSGDSIFND